MNIENLSVLKINKMSQKRYEEELAAGNIKDNEIYLTPDDNTGGGDAIELDITLTQEGKPADAKAVGDKIAALNVPSSLSDLSEDATHRTVTDEEKVAWNAKSNFSGSYNDLTNKPTIPTKTSELTNDSNYITQTDLETYINNAILGGAW